MTKQIIDPTAPETGDSMKTAQTLADLRATIDAWRRQGLTVGFVPTMGALHEGHFSLVRQSAETADRTVVSIFVNPKQFAPGEDLATYPRNEARDLAMIAEASCNLAWLPTPEVMYPPGYQTSVSVSDVSQGLCGASRPHFFGGVATVVCKLLNQVRPTHAIFGEKDFQQLLVIRRMVRDLDMDVKILGGPIVREPDGLAMSSRNAYLSAEERRIAGNLNRVIAEMATQLEVGVATEDVISSGRKAIIDAGFPSIDYLDIRHVEDLSRAPAGRLLAEARVFVAVQLGRTRLIDNWPAAPKP
jgi:pantoate--beta-alanine ligase